MPGSIASNLYAILNTCHSELIGTELRFLNMKEQIHGQVP